MSSWVHEWMSGWGGPTDATIDLLPGDVIAGATPIDISIERQFPAIVDEVRIVPAKAKKKRRRSFSSLVELTSGDVLASGEALDVIGESTADVKRAAAGAGAAAVSVVADAVIELASADVCTLSAEIAITTDVVIDLGCSSVTAAAATADICGEHRGIFVIAGDVVRITRPAARLRLNKNGVLEAA